MRAVNLIPADQRGGVALGAGRSEGVAYGVPVLLAGLAVLAFLYGQARHQISSRTAAAATISAQASKANSEAAGLASYTSFITTRNEREKAVTELVNARFDWAHSFHELGRVLPSGVWLTSISGAVSSSATGSPAGSAPAATGAVTSSTPPGSVPTFSLSGCASSQAQVALALDRLRLIDGVDAVTLQSSTDGTAAGPTTASACKTSFTAELTFEALPTTAAVTAATSAAKTTSRTVLDTTGGGK
jgi:Tfp pilus assembly protein PilN